MWMQKTKAIRRVKEDRIISTGKKQKVHADGN
jgi:hypothetical protein